MPGVEGPASTFDATSTMFELRFDSLFRPGAGLSFPCSADGQVDIDTLTEKCKSNYLVARALIGHDYACPRVVRAWRGSRMRLETN